MSDDASPRAVLHGFVPEFVRERLAAFDLAPTQPWSDRSEAAVLAADLSGFTQLSERLAEAGASGAEQLKDILNRCFDGLVELVDRHGGQVVKFAGDATLAIWLDSERARGLTAAARCGVEILQRLDGLEAQPGIRLRLRVGLAAGQVSISYLGGHEGRWEFLVGGSPMEQMARALEAASPGQVLLAESAWPGIETQAKGTSLPGGFIEVQTVAGDVIGTDAGTRVTTVTPEDRIRGYIPRAVQARIDAGQEDWLAEFRRASIVFVNLPGLDWDQPTALVDAQRILAVVQRSVYRYGGSINQFLVDDKGTTLVAGWGLSMHTHEDDAERAALAALALQRGLASLELRASVGIATGRIFAGVRGNLRRREFAMIGNVVNLAARLMQRADGTILCDAATRAAARSRAGFETLEPMTFKGRAGSERVFRIAFARSGREDSSALIGRETEREILAATLAALERGESRGAVTVEGQAGIGKTRLIQDLLERTQASPVRGLLGSADALERSAYLAFRNVFDRLLSLPPTTELEARHRRVLSLLGLEDGTEGRAAVLNSVLSLDLAGGEWVSRMTAQGRAEATRDLLVRLIKAAVSETPTLIIVEDGYWLDTSSWQLIESLARSDSNLALVVTTRPLTPERMTDEIRRLLEDPATTRIHLEPMDQDQSISLICRSLGADSVPQPVAELVRLKAEGHPFFIEQMAFAMRDSGVVRIEAGECVLAADRRALEALEFPDTVQDVVRGRIDSLAPDQQMTLKSASILGRRFPLFGLREIHPVETDADSLKQQLDVMARLELVVPVGNLDEVYTFNHAITLDVAYNLLPFAQRGQLHHRAAEWYEETHTADPSSVLPLLAHHWSHSDEPVRGLEFLEQAGSEALSRFNNQEAIVWLKRALEISSANPGSATALERARWYRLLGEGYKGLWDYNHAAECFDATLALLEESVPHSGTRRNLFVVGQAFRQVSHLVIGSGRGRSAPSDETDRLLEASRAASALAWIDVLRQDGLGVLAASLKSVNLAERAGTTNVYSMGMMGMTASRLKLPRLAARYFRRGREEGRRQGEVREHLDMLVFEAVDHIGAARFVEAEAALAESLELAESIDDRLGIAMALVAFGSTSQAQGRYTDTLAFQQRALERLGDEEAGRLRYWVLIGIVYTQSNLKSPAEALEIFERHRDTIAAGMSGENEEEGLSFLAALEASICNAVGQIDRAIRAADRAVDHVSRNVGGLPVTLLGIFEGPLETYLGRLQSNPKDRAARQGARRALRALRRMARFYSLAGAHLAYWQGRLAWVEGSRARAEKRWRRGAELAQEKSIFIIEGRCYQALGVSAPSGSESRTEWLERARDVFRKIEATRASMEIEALLKLGSRMP